jgi:hypothetical protein
LSKDITDTGSTNTDKHLHKLGTRDTDEWDTGFTGNGLGKKGLSCTWGSIQDDTTWDTATILGVRLGLFQKVDDFGQFQLGSVASGNVIKGDSSVGNHLNLCFRFSKSHGASRAARHATSTSRSATQKEQTCKESGRKDETLRKFSESTGFLLRKDSDIDL